MPRCKETGTGPMAAGPLRVEPYIVISYITSVA